MNRKRLFLIILTLALVVLLSSACQPASPTATPEPAQQPTTPPTTQPTTPPTAAPTAQPTAEPTEETFSASVTDGLDETITLNAKPVHIVSMTLGTDEILLDLVGPERLAAITYLASDATTSNIADRPELAQVPNVIQPNPSPEQIIALEPDLVFVATFTDATVIQQIRDAGIAVYAVGFFNSIDAMEENILTIGTLVGEPEKAQAMVDEMQNRLDAVAQAVSGADSPSVLYLASGGWVAGSATTTDDIITHAGGTNSAADLVDWNQISEETIIEMNPDFVILSPYVTNDEFTGNAIYAGLTAVQNGNAIPLSDAYLSATSQYIVRGVEVLAHVLHPDLVPEPEYVSGG